MILTVCLASAANAEVWLSVNGQAMLPGSEVWLSRGDIVTIEIWGDGISPMPLEGFLYVEGPGAIDGYVLYYAGSASSYWDLEELADLMGMSPEDVLAEADVNDLSKFSLDDETVPEAPLEGLLIDEIEFQCKGQGDVLLTMQHNDPYTAYEDYTITIHQVGSSCSYYVDANQGDDNNTGLTADSALATIQKAIDLATDKDTVVVLPGVYTGSGNRDIDFDGKAITVRSADPNDPNVVASTIVACYGAEAEPHRGFYFHNGEDTNSVLNGLTITGGYADAGGGICCVESNPTVRNCTLYSNHAPHGGAMSNTNCAGLAVAGCTFKENSAILGGGISNHSSDLSLTGCTFAGNSADNYGGAIFNEGSSPTVFNSVFAGNRSGRDMGSAVYNLLDSNPVLINCTLIANRGGAVNNFGSAPTLTNCILWSNTPYQIWLGTSISYSDVEGGWPGAGGINTDPCFADAGYWDPNGTPTDPNDDFWVDGDYHLQSQAARWEPSSRTWVTDDLTSPCIDAGNPASLLGCEPDGPHNKRVNMGAYGGTSQASKTPADWSLLGDLNNDGAVDGSDFALQAEDWRQNAAQRPGDLDRNSVVDASDVALLVQEWLRAVSRH